MTTTITRENFTKAMREAVAERGADYVYPKFNVALPTDWHRGMGACVYALPNGEPACIIGVALHKIDPTLDLVSAEARINDDCSDTSAETMLTLLGVHDEQLLWAAGKAQVIQDVGGTWGYALEEFERVLDGEPVNL